MSLEALTRASTACIVASGACLLIGWFLIKVLHRVPAHRNVMLLATTLAGGFLVAYVTRWALYGTKRFTGTGVWRTIYFSTLVPHVILAVAVGPLAVQLIRLALVKRDFAAHRRLARVTLPIWLYVAASGWMIYYMLYRMQFEGSGG